MKSIDLFIKTYAQDFKLLDYSLQSIIKNVTGYSYIVILVPEKDFKLFRQTVTHIPVNTAIWVIPEIYSNGYLFQQVCKLKAHKYSHADYILFSDSDCIYDHSINLQDFVADDKPEILYTSYDKADGAIIWQKPTEAFIEDSMPWELMRRNCLIYHRSTLANVEYFAKSLHGKSIEEYVMNSGSFSEFNAIGAYAFLHEPGKYNFVNTDNWEYTKPKAIQLWSYGTKDGDETHKREYQRSIDTINKALGLNVTEL